MKIKKRVKERFTHPSSSNLEAVSKPPCFISSQNSQFQSDSKSFPERSIRYTRISLGWIQMSSLHFNLCLLKMKSCIDVSGGVVVELEENFRIRKQRQGDCQGGVVLLIEVGSGEMEDLNQERFGVDVGEQRSKSGWSEEKKNVESLRQFLNLLSNIISLSKLTFKFIYATQALK